MSFALDAKEQRELDAGKVPTRLETFQTRDGKSAGRGFGVVRIARSAAQVFDVVTNFEERTRFVPRLVGVEVLEKSDSHLRVKQLSDATIRVVPTTCWFELDRASLSMRWRLDREALDNGIADVEGAYEVVPEGAHCLLGYRAYLDTGLWIPKAVQAHLSKRAIPDLLLAIKRHCEASLPHP